MPTVQSKGSHWYPTVDQVKDPTATHRAMKQVLDQFYVLQDRHDALQRDHSALLARVNVKRDGPPPGSGPTDSMLLGLHVAPIDTTTLANATTLKWNKETGTIGFF